MAHLRRYGCQTPDELLQPSIAFGLEEAFHHCPPIRRLIRKASGREHPTADSTKTGLEASQLGDQWGRQIDRPEDAHLVRVGSPRDGRCGGVDIFPPQLPNRTDPSPSGLGQHQREFKANPLVSLGRAIRSLSTPPLYCTTRRVKAFLACHWSARILLRIACRSTRSASADPARVGCDTWTTVSMCTRPNRTTLRSCR
jgi:hypothetical protein